MMATGHGLVAERARSGLALPEDILGHIHALMPMRDAARAACVSHGFLRSWRCDPRLDFDMDTLGLELDPLFDSRALIEEELPLIENQMRKGIITTMQDYFRKNNPMIREYSARVDHIMQHHSGTGIKTFRLRRPPHGFYISPVILDRWVQAAITGGTITEFELLLEMGDDDNDVGYYSFPCSLLSTKMRGGSITSFSLSGCSFHSAHRAGCLTSLTRLRLHHVRVTAEEFSCFLSTSCPALERLEISVCHDTVCLKIPRLMSRLKQSLHVRNSSKKSLQMIECDAPKLKSFGYVGTPPIHVSLGPSVREMQMSSMDEPGGMLSYATTKIPSIAPNLRSLSLASCFEMVDTPMPFDKLRRLKSLEIHLDRPSRCPDYDFYSLVSFLNASPALDTFVLHLQMPDASVHASIPEDSYGNS